MTAGSGHAVVIGGGVIGAACAYYLSQAGRRVTVLDSGAFGRGCSHGNCGLVCPSHVLPLPQPGAVRDAFAAMFARNAPFRIKPRFDPGLWWWFWRFMRRCTREHMLEAGRARLALLNSSMLLYEQLLADESIDCEWEQRGLLMVFQSAAGMDHYAATDALMREQFDLPATRYDSDAISELEPALKPGLAGGWHYETDAHLRPDKLMRELRRVLEQRGVTFREQCRLRDLRREGNRAVAAATPDGDIEADQFIVCTGALTPLLNGQLGCKIPIQPGKGYSITMPRPERCPRIPLIFHERRVAVTPMQSGYRLGSTMEFAGYNSALNPRRLALLKQGAEPYLHEPYGEMVEEEWYGWRPMTYDGKPYIGPTPGCGNVLVAAGHNMLGLSMAPATGKLAAELAAGETPHIDPAPYAVDRS